MGQIVVMVSSHLKMHQVVYINYAEFLVCQSYFHKVKNVEIDTTLKIILKLVDDDIISILKYILVNIFLKLKKLSVYSDLFILFKKCSTHVHPRWIHIDVWQNQYNIVISLQLK